jgi:hypothetical protein
MKLRYKQGGRDFKEWFVYLTETHLTVYAGGAHWIGKKYQESVSGLLLYEFKERRKLIRVKTHVSEGFGKVQIHDPTDGGTRIVNPPRNSLSNESISVMKEVFE